VKLALRGRTINPENLKKFSKMALEDYNGELRAPQANSLVELIVMADAEKQ